MVPGTSPLLEQLLGFSIKKKKQGKMNNVEAWHAGITQFNTVNFESRPLNLGTVGHFWENGKIKINYKKNR